MKQYLKATIYTTTAGAEALLPVLAPFGITGCSIEDPSDLEYIRMQRDGPLWDYIDEALGGADGDGRQGGSGAAGGGGADGPDGEVRLTFFLPEGAEADGRLEEIRIALFKLKSDEQYFVYGEGADFGRLWMESEVVTDDWSDRYKEDFHAFAACEGIWVYPPWEPRPKIPEGDIAVQIDPGMAFGTGAHETTSLCLAALREALALRPGARVLDAGTGSGILAITAALLPGGARVTAVEVDADAAASAEGNIRANGASGAIRLVVGDILEEGALAGDGPFDVIIANLTSGILRRLLPRFRGLLAEGGTLLLSGILDAQGEEMKEALENAGFSSITAFAKGEWLLLRAGHAEGGG
ncbi:MAG: 50S ribosomal protein L11 methyltransferase [Clostridiales Family XIII bacterium]|jgi:ribosomal protein L11 methyltransferase|nr:50S ribosomal protein L11 methyltransferase [Clostridiales Family XIII bacterium]